MSALFLLLKENNRLVYQVAKQDSKAQLSTVSHCCQHSASVWQKGRGAGRTGGATYCEALAGEKGCTSLQRTTAILQRAGEERRCTEMRRRGDAATSEGASQTSKMHYRGMQKAREEEEREEEEGEVQRLHVKLASGGFWPLFGL